MRRASRTLVNDRRLEVGAPVVVVLPHAEDRPLVRAAMALAHGHRTRLRVLALHGRGEDLPLPLRMAMFGLDPRSEADRAIRHLVDSAARGAHTAIRVIRDEDARAAQAEALRGLPTGAILVVGRVRGRPGPDPAMLRPLIAAHPGPILVVDAAGGPAIAEVLAILPPGRRAVAAALRHVHALERSYATFRREEVDDPVDLEICAKDCTEEVLAFIAAPSDSDLGAVEPFAGRLGELSTGPVAVLIPAGPEAPASSERLLFG